MNPNEQSNDANIMMEVIAAGSVALWDKGFEVWSRCWVHEPYVRVMGWWARGGVTVIKGWETVSSRMKEVMTENPEPNPTASKVRRENINLHIDGNMAWVT